MDVLDIADFTKINEKLNYLQNDDTLKFDSMFESGNLF